ncbi:hypothetical protein V8D89_002853 [Ganoderma adspersum]
MSSQVDIASIVSEVLDRRITNYFLKAGCGIVFPRAHTNRSNDLSHLALVVFEYFITLRCEIQLFWKGKCTGAAILFYFNRYLSLAVNIYEVAFKDYISSTQSCTEEIKALRSIDYMQYLFWAGPTGVLDPIIGCIGIDDVSQDLSKLHDIFHVFVTFSCSRAIANVFFPLQSHPGAIENFSFVLQLREPLAAILVSRFLLDLQSANRRASNARGTTITLHDGGTGSLVFERVIGPLGSSIYVDPGSYSDMFDEDEDEDEDEGGLTMDPQDPRLTEMGGWHCPNVDADLEGGSQAEMTTPSSPESRFWTTS